MLKNCIKLILCLISFANYMVAMDTGNSLSLFDSISGPEYTGDDSNSFFTSMYGPAYVEDRISSLFTPLDGPAYLSSEIEQIDEPVYLSSEIEQKIEPIGAKRDYLKSGFKKLFKKPDIRVKGLMLAAAYRGDPYLVERLGRRNNIEAIFEARLLAAVKDGNLNLVEKLHEENPTFSFDFYDKSTENSRLTPIDIAADYGHVHISEYFLKMGVLPRREGIFGACEMRFLVGKKTGAFLIPKKLREAICSGDLELTTELIEKAKEEDTFDAYNRVDNVSRTTALHLAAFHGHKGIAGLLLISQADPNARDVDRRTPLHIAFSKKYLEIAVLLYNHGADLSSLRDQ